MAKRSTVRAVPANRRHEQRLVVDHKRRADGQARRLAEDRGGCHDSFGQRQCRIRGGNGFGEDDRRAGETVEPDGVQFCTMAALSVRFKVRVTIGTMGCS
jgi:hypothetical protein